jgi:hypothetical protein
MPKLASYRRIIKNDFKKEEQEFVEKLASPINDSFNELYFAMNGRLSIRENLFATVRDVEITVDSDGIPVATTSFTLDKPGQVAGTDVILAVNQVNSAGYPTAQPFISFTQNSSNVIINHISGLQPNQRYIVRVVAYLN